MQKSVFLSFVCFVSLTFSMGANAKEAVDIEQQVEQLRQENIQLKNELELLTKKVTQESAITDKSFTGISNQLSAASTAATWFSVVLVIVSIALGAFIAWLSNKTKNAADSASETLLKVEQMKREAQQLKEDTANNLRDLNLRLFDDETTHLLVRLQKYPRDIGNMSEVLALRTLNNSQVEMTKRAYEKYVNQVGDKQHKAFKYFMIVGQHAPELMLTDHIWRKLYNQIVKPFAPNAISVFYDDELHNFTEKCIKPAIDNGKLAEYKNEVSNFLLLLVYQITNEHNGSYSKQFQTEILNDLMSYIENQNLKNNLSPEFLTKYEDWKQAAPT